LINITSERIMSVDESYKLASKTFDWSKYWNESLIDTHAKSTQ
jgi:hypothetical protein